MFLAFHILANLISALVAAPILVLISILLLHSSVMVAPKYLTFSIVHHDVNNLGEIAVITGGTSGIGAEVVQKLIAMKMKVIVVHIAEQVFILDVKYFLDNPQSSVDIDKIQETSSGSVQYRYLDLSNLQSVSSFAEQLKYENLNISVLIHCVTAAYLEDSCDCQILAEINKLNFNDIIDDLCAYLSNSIDPTPPSALKEQLASICRDEKKMELKPGVMFCSENRTVDGFDYQFGVNYLGAALLTLSLLPCLQHNQEGYKSSQIVFLSSVAISGDHFSAFSMYAWSKLALILFAYALHQKINKTSNSSKIRVICLHPGIVDTKLYQHVWFAKLFPVLLKMFFLTKEQGATNVLQAIYSAETENDHCFYWSDGMVTKSSPLSYDPVMQNELWKQTISTLSSWLVPKLKREFSLDG
ncbi:Dehydrogenase/reductase SDR family member on chromosome X [Nymphon striatum]|nr:Dehydrogenase/reductase SDR family member on chromosome X [Nymphon striatum]